MVDTSNKDNSEVSNHQMVNQEEEIFANIENNTSVENKQLNEKMDEKLLTKSIKKKERGPLQRLQLFQTTKQGRKQNMEMDLNTGLVVRWQLNFRYDHRIPVKRGKYLIGIRMLFLNGM